MVLPGEGVSEQPLLDVQSRAGVLRVTIDRPHKRNALSRATLDALRDEFSTRAQDPDLRVAVLRGAGDKSFAAGGNLYDLSAVRTRAQTEAMVEQAWAALDAVRRFPVPVIALLNGDAIGGGAELALACDLRVAATGARIGFVQGRLNISTAWGGGGDLLRLLGPSRGLRLLATSEVLDAESALALGLIDARIDEGTDAELFLDDYLEPFLRQVPQVMRAFKALALGARDGLPTDEMRAMEQRHIAETWIHEDHWEATQRVLASMGRHRR